jgi:hypothetical protein
MNSDKRKAEATRRREEFVSALVALMDRKQWSIADTARNLGVSYSIVHRAVRGKHRKEVSYVLFEAARWRYPLYFSREWEPLHGDRRHTTNNKGRVYPVYPIIQDAKVKAKYEELGAEYRIPEEQRVPEEHRRLTVGNKEAIIEELAAACGRAGFSSFHATGVVSKNASRAWEGDNTTLMGLRNFINLCLASGVRPSWVLRRAGL